MTRTAAHLQRFLGHPLFKNLPQLIMGIVISPIGEQAS